LLVCIYRRAATAGFGFLGGVHKSLWIAGCLLVAWEIVLTTNGMLVSPNEPDKKNHPPPPQLIPHKQLFLVLLNEWRDWIWIGVSLFLHLYRFYSLLYDPEQKQKMHWLEGKTTTIAGHYKELGTTMGII